FAGLLRQDGYRLEAVEGFALSSVVPAAKLAMAALAEDMVDGPLVVVEPGVRTGMPINIDNPREVGADRVVNAVAASQRYGTPVIAVDFGTSTNMDVVDASGAYVGGS
ncbi:MAG: type III pantothenate kinase, partial [Actinobacteria bacterium]|nr:type III pantothenate kinase [Actinomycetota bacterium]NIS36995.1 type III pantothenate kinase [Actinomycetota bacterium]NIT99017.1 type III pantothenate kinase [Actinomycetota bacterium]NIU22644.1 type III pantothenate kinase [Actinomycetota bacterium]NIU71458.1 type III pantothenate kinase [Actinomycetota bacterium]